MSSGSSDLYAFGCYGWILHRESIPLRRAGSAWPKTFDLLVILASSGGRLLSRPELMTPFGPTRSLRREI